MTWPVPAPRLALLALLGAVAVFVLPEMGQTDLGVFVVDNRFLYANAILLLVAVADTLLAPAPGQLAVERIHPRAVTLDHPTTISWVVEPPRRFRAFGATKAVRLADELAPSLGAATRRVELAIAAGGTSTASVDVKPARRGRFEPTELVVRTTGPLGVMFKQRRRRHRTTLKVLPPFRSAKEAELSLRRARILEIGLRSARGRGGGTEFDSLRELTPDDETRRIDWAATARTQRPIVRTYRAERNQTVLCMLDSGRTMAGRVAGVPRMEFAMDGAMLLAELATGLGDRMGLISFDQRINTTIEPSNRRSQRAQISERLFDLEPALNESNYQNAVTHVLGRYRRRSFLVLLSELGEEAVDQYLIPTLPLLIRKHLVVVAAIQDPDLVEWTTATPADEDGAFLRAAAIESLGRRSALAARLRGMGAVVIDAPPDEFATKLGDAYLDAKAVGRL